MYWLGSAGEGEARQGLAIRGVAMQVRDWSGEACYCTAMFGESRPGRASQGYQRHSALCRCKSYTLVLPGDVRYGRSGQFPARL